MNNVCCVLRSMFMATTWAMSSKNLFIPYANNKGTDQPVHPGSLISTFVVYVNNKGADQPVHLGSLISAFVVRCLDSKIPLLAIVKISRL